MTAGAAGGIRVVLLDIEGTTTPVSFVYEVLFPYARRQLRPYVEANFADDGVADAGRLLESEWVGDAPGAPGPPTDADRLIAYAEWLMDRDRKSPGLKLLQGLIWQRGYEAGELRGVLFPDVAPAFEAWRRAGRRIAIYSSGSVLAQRLLFAFNDARDLTPFIDAFFDTAVGPKTAADSYRRIAAELGSPPGEILFVSDAPAELAAARAAGCAVVLSVRPGNHPAGERDLPRAMSLAEI